MKFLFVAVSIIGALLAYVSQVGYREATISILENKLLTDSSGSIYGDLVCSCQMSDCKVAFEFDCSIEECDKAELLEISEDTSWKIRYRDRPPFGIFSREDPYAMFIYSKLGFRADEVVGQYCAYDHDVVLIRQQSEE